MSGVDIEPLKVAVLGCGSVGSQVVRLLDKQADDLAARIGAPVELVGVGVRRLDAQREVEVPDGLLTTDSAELVTRADLVVEVIGGIEPARGLILSALESGASVVTANKALLAEYAEADPTADVEGFDAAAKAAILASLAFHTRVTAADVHREGISEVTAADVASAADMGCVVKLLAICELRVQPDGEEAVAVRVHPAMIPRSHPLASVREAYNAVFVESDAAGQLMFYGPGAGGSPTASAVLGDLVTVARNRLSETRGAGESAYTDRAVLPMGETVTRYHVAIDVDDKAGVLAAVALAFAEHGVSIQTVRQEGRGDDAQLVVVSHDATDAQLSATVTHLQQMDIVREVTSVMRVEGGAE